MFDRELTILYATETETLCKKFGSEKKVEDILKNRLQDYEELLKSLIERNFDEKIISRYKTLIQMIYATIKKT